METPDKAGRLTKNKTIAERFAELREIFRQENYRLPTSRRRTTRENAFVKVLDELAGKTEKEVDAILVSQADDPNAWEEEAHVRPRKWS
jgi:Asp/Glu/hydantoin racemase